MATLDYAIFLKKEGNTVLSTSEKAQVMKDTGRRIYRDVYFYDKKRFWKFEVWTDGTRLMVIDII